MADQENKRRRTRPNPSTSGDGGSPSFNNFGNPSRNRKQASNQTDLIAASSHQVAPQAKTPSMMMSRVYRLSSGLSDWMGNNAGVVVTFVIGQGITALIFLTLLAGRVTTIETRGSPEVVMLERRVSAMESHDSNQEKQMAGIEHFNTKLTALDVRLTAVEVKQGNVLDSLKSNGSKLDHAIDILNAHMSSENNRNRK